MVVLVEDIETESECEYIGPVQVSWDFDGAESMASGSLSLESLESLLQESEEQDNHQPQKMNLNHSSPLSIDANQDLRKDSRQASGRAATVAIARLVSANGGQLPEPLIRSLSPYLTQFQELRVLGHGAFGSVVKAIGRIDQRVVAIKKVMFSSCIPPWAARGAVEAAHEDVLREARALALLSHPAITQYHSAWIEPVFELLAQSLVSPSSESAEGVKTRHAERESEREEEVVGRKHSFASSSRFSAGTSTSGEGSCPDSPTAAGAAAMPSSPRVCGAEPMSMSQTSTSNSTPELVTPAASGQRVQWYYNLHVVMEFCSACNLNEWLLSRGGDVDKVARAECHIFYELLGAVSYLHAHGVMHRDMKPENIFVFDHPEKDYEGDTSSSAPLPPHPSRQYYRGGTRDLKPSKLDYPLPKIKLGDFGLATWISAKSKTRSQGMRRENSASLMHLPEVGAGRNGEDVSSKDDVGRQDSGRLGSRTGSGFSEEDMFRTGQLGTPQYAAPEQWHGEKYGSKADIFSLGLILVEMFTPGLDCVDDRARSVVLRQAREGTLPTRLSEEFPAQAAIAHWMLNSDPVQRPNAASVLQRWRLLLSSFDTEPNLSSSPSLKRMADEKSTKPFSRTSSSPDVMNS